MSNRRQQQTDRIAGTLGSSTVAPPPPPPASGVTTTTTTTTIITNTTISSSNNNAPSRTTTTTNNNTDNGTANASANTGMAATGTTSSSDYCGSSFYNKYSFNAPSRTTTAMTNTNVPYQPPHHPPHHPPYHHPPYHTTTNNNSMFGTTTTNRTILNIDLSTECRAPGHTASMNAILQMLFDTDKSSNLTDEEKCVLFNVGHFASGEFSNGVKLNPNLTREKKAEYLRKGTKMFNNAERYLFEKDNAVQMKRLIKKVYGDRGRR